MALTLLRVDERHSATEHSAIEHSAVEATHLPVVIGRSDNAQVRVNSRWASRRHCEIDQIDGRFVLRDLGSRHGTIVNGVSVTETELRPGDEIGIGLTRFVVKLIGMEHCSNLKLESNSC